jgi:catechol 2,3-dioxygenase-like lactoylglutathione lyase family enzyme
MADDVVRWRGVHHLALVTEDMDATVRFWHGVLGARLVHTLGTPAFRHYFFEVAPGSTIAFFEYRDIDLDGFAKPAGIPYERAAQFDHLSLALADEESLHRMQARLREHGCEVTEVVDHGSMRSIYFSDPTGIALEASWWVLDATAQTGDLGDTRFYADGDPVPAVRELHEHGRLLSTTSTQLVDGISPR